MVDNGENAVKVANAQVAAFMKENPTIKVTVDTRPQGTDGDNFVKTRLSTGEMADLFAYNSGSLLQALDPAKNLVPLTSEPWVANLGDSFKTAVSVGSELYGAPFGTATGGGILYNKKVFADLGLQVPTTWAEFMANNAKIKAAGIDPVIQSYGDTWTSQLLILADFNNINKIDPQWAEKYTKNDPTAKYAVAPALSSFQRLEDVKKAGYLNKNFASMKYDQAQAYLTAGKGAQYPMATWAIPQMVTNDPANKDNIGYFPQPGDSSSHPRCDPVDPLRYLHPDHHDRRQAGRCQEVRGLGREQGSVRPVRSDGDRGRRVRGQGLHPARRHRSGREGRPGLRRCRQVEPGPGVPLPGQGPEHGEDHRRGGLRHQLGGRRRQALRRGRQEAGPAARPRRLVS